MRKHKDSKLNKMLLLITALVMVLLLSGCRTRISNNTEVASTISDEDGWLQDSYQMRRDDLGMPVAKKPFITGSAQDEEDVYGEEYERDLQELDEYEPDLEEEDLDDSSDDSNGNSSSQSVSSSTTTRRNTSTTASRRRTATTKKKTSNTKKETKTESDTSSPTPPAQEQQEQQEQPKKTYTVSFDGNGVDMDGATISVEEGGKYGSLPSPPAREDYTFDGWFTEKEGGKEVKEGSDFTSDGDQTLYAHWTKKDPAEVWGNRFDIAANDQTDKLDCQLMPDDTGKSTVEACKGNIVAPENGPKCIIFFAPAEEISAETAQTIFEEKAATNPALEKVIIISDDAINGKDNQKLFYKLVLLDTMHGKVGQDTLDKAASELGISPIWPATYPNP